MAGAGGNGVHPPRCRRRRRRPGRHGGHRISPHPTDRCRRPDCPLPPQATLRLPFNWPCTEGFQKPLTAGNRGAVDNPKITLTARGTGQPRKTPDQPVAPPYPDSHQLAVSKTAEESYRRSQAKSDGFIHHLRELFAPSNRYTRTDGSSPTVDESWSTLPEIPLNQTRRD